MKYDFDKITDRTNTNSLKWDIKENELPMWVADMDFETAPAVREALQKRLDNGIFGYSIVPDKWYDAYALWWKTRYNYVIKPEWLVFCTGVVAAISSIVRKLTTPAENVLIQTPVYNIFYNSILNNGRNVVENPLKYSDGAYEMDFEDLEKKLSNPQTTMMILCNPQNPAGKIWDRETLARVGEMCKGYNVLVVSDEIHCDITDPGLSYVPFASVNETCADNSITCIAPSKSFNIAGLCSAAIMCKNDNIRHKAQRGLNTDECAEPNAFAVDAAVAAYTQGGQWLDELNKYIYENKKLAEDFIKTQISEISLIKSDATYLLWLDCTAVCKSSVRLADYIRKNTGLWLSTGDIYGGNGDGFLRMNIGCPKVYLNDGLERLKKGIASYISHNGKA